MDELIWHSLSSLQRRLIIYGFGIYIINFG